MQGRGDYILTSKQLPLCCHEGTCQDKPLKTGWGHLVKNVSFYSDKVQVQDYNISKYQPDRQFFLYFSNQYFLVMLFPYSKLQKWLIKDRLEDVMAALRSKLEGVPSQSLREELQAILTRWEHYRRTRREGGACKSARRCGSGCRKWKQRITRGIAGPPT